MSEFKLDYTASEINQKLGEIDKKLETVDWGGITNRPFYEEEVEKLLFKTTGISKANEYCGLYSTTLSQNIIQGTFIGERKYRIVFNGTEYVLPLGCYCDGAYSCYSFGFNIEKIWASVVDIENKNIPFVISINSNKLYEEVKDFNYDTNGKVDWKDFELSLPDDCVLNVLLYDSPSTDFTLEIYDDAISIKTIDEKYINDMYYSEHEIILEETMSTFTESNGLYVTPIQDTNLSKKFELGYTYTVIWDGVGYKDIELGMFDNENFNLGAKLVNGDFVFGNISFGLLVINGQGVIVFTNENSSSHTISIIKNTNHPLDKKYLPNDCQTTTKIDNQLSTEEFINLQEGYYDLVNGVTVYDGSWVNSDEDMSSFFDNYSDYQTQINGFMHIVPHTSDGYIGVCYYDFGTEYMLFYMSHLDTGLDKDILVIGQKRSLDGFGYKEAQNFLGYEKENLNTEAKTVIGAINEINDNITILPIERLSDFGAEITVSTADNSNTTNLYGGASYRRDIILNADMDNPSNYIFCCSIPDGYTVGGIWMKFGNQTLALVMNQHTAVYYHVIHDKKSKMFRVTELISGDTAKCEYDTDGNYVTKKIINNVDSDNIITKLNSKTKSNSYSPTAATDVATKEYVDNLSQSFILNSSTEGSTKRFKVTVDDSGKLTTTEITS